MISLFLFIYFVLIGTQGIIFVHSGSSTINEVANAELLIMVIFCDISF